MATYNFKNKKSIIKALQFRGEKQKRLFEYARQLRDDIFCGHVEIRSVVEYSNICQQSCNFCGMNKYSSLKRYIMSGNELLQKVDKLYRLGRRIIMLQTGEYASGRYFEHLSSLLRDIKNKYADLEIIGSFGNLSEDKYKKLKAIGVERYLLKFETSNPKLYKKIKPSDTLHNRLTHIEMLKGLGFYVSSGNITGLPGQTLAGLANDLLLLKKLDIPMGSTSAFIPNDMSNYANYAPADIDLVFNFMATLRIMCPTLLIPSTSSLELLAKNGQYIGLMAGANVVTLHDGTPKNKEDDFVIYKKNRCKPTTTLFKDVKKAGLKNYNRSLLRDKEEKSLFLKLINRNINSNRVAVYFEGRQYAYRDLFTMTSKFCSFLKNNKIEKGQVVLLSVFDSIEFVIAFLSCIRLGIIVAPIDPQLDINELNYIIFESEAVCVLATDSVYKKIKGKKALKISDDNSIGYFIWLLKKQKDYNKIVSPDTNNPAVILYTSGTTGRPKGVMHNYKDLFVDNFPRLVLKMSEESRVFSCSKMHTSFGLGNSLLFPFHSGASTILLRNLPDPFSLQKALKQKPTLFFAVPSMYEFLLNYTERLKKAFKTVRLFVCSGEKLYSDIFLKWKAIYNKNLLECYGSSEMCHPFISNMPGKEKINSCGKPLDGFNLKFNKDSRLFYTGPSIMKCYHNDIKLTRARIINGWFKSDDIACMDKDGYIFLKGRHNLVFKFNGKWLSILDIENKLREFSLVREITVVREQKNLDFYIALRAEMDAEYAKSKIRQYCIENLKVNELPKNIYILDKIPKTNAGKIKRSYSKALRLC